MSLSLYFFFNDTATTEIYTLSLHDALPISVRRISAPSFWASSATLKAMDCGVSTPVTRIFLPWSSIGLQDRKSTRLNSSHANISYAVFCLKKKKTNDTSQHLHESTTLLTNL